MSLYDMLVHYLSSIISLVIMIIIYKNTFKNCKINIKTILIILLFSLLSTINTLVNYTFSKILIFYFLYVISLYFIFKDNVKNLISRSIFIYLTIMIVEVFISIILLFSPFSNILEMNNNSLFKLFISTLILFVALFIFYIKPFKKLIKDTVDFFDKKDLLFNLLVVTLIIFLISCITFKNALNFKSITYSAINIITLICFIIIFSVCLYNIILRKKAEDKEEVLLNFIKEYEYLIDKDRINRHEMLNNLLVIKSFKNRNSKDFENLIDQFINNYKMAGSKIASNLYNLPSGLKGMVYYKIYDMEKYNIKVETNISNKVVGKLDNLDATTYTKICKIIGILIDNAIEGTNNTNKKEISITMIKIDEVIKITITNTTDVSKININKINEKNYSSKGKNRGYGLYLVNKIVSSSENLEINQEILKNKFKTTLSIKIN